MMTIVEARGGYLYEHAPHICPYGFLTDVEVYLWHLHGVETAARSKRHG